MPIKFFFHCLMVVLSTWARQGFASSSNTIQEKNSQFMHRPTFIEELYQTHQITTTLTDTLTQKQFFTIQSREEIEAGGITIQIFRKPRYAMQEIYRAAEERIEEIEISEQQTLSAQEKIKIREQTLKEKINATDKQVIEGVALAVENTAAEKLMSLFSDLGRFHHFSPDIFLESHHLSEAELRSRNIFPKENIKFQYSKVQIAGVIFSQTLRYEITSAFKIFQEKTDSGIVPVEKECFEVAWEIDPLFQEDEEFSQQGVLINSGRFIIEPYVQKDGIMDPSRSVILYHVYIKIDPLNYLIDILHKLFSGSEARKVLNELATAMRREGSLR